MKRNLYILGLCIIVIALIVSFIFYKQMKEENEQAASLNAEKEKTTGEEIKLKKETNDIVSEKQGLNADLQRESGNVQQLHEEIKEVTNVEKVLASQVLEKDRDYSGLVNMLNTISEKESGLNEELKKAKLDYMSVSEQVSYLRKEKRGLEDGIREYIAPPEGVELKKIVVKVTPPVEGKVIEVNKEFSFSIINLGLADDIRSGNTVAIHRNGEFIAKAVVENVYKDMSSVIVLNEWSDIAVAPGDTVRLLKP